MIFNPCIKFKNEGSAHPGRSAAGKEGDGEQTNLGPAPPGGRG